MKTYHLLDIVTFDQNRDLFRSTQQLSVEDSQPISKLTKITANFYKDFAKYELFHEVKRRSRGRAYGNPESFSSYVNQNTFDCYHWKSRNIFIFGANKPAVNGSIKRLTRDCGKGVFELKRGMVNFQKIIRKAENITGGWFGDLSGNVTSIGLFGDHVNMSSDYDRYSAAGSLSSLTIEVTLGGQMYSFMITKDRAIVLYDSMSIEKDLDLLTQIYNELL